MIVGPVNGDSTDSNSVASKLQAGERVGEIFKRLDLGDLINFDHGMLRNDQKNVQSLRKKKKKQQQQRR
jgi:hypothetical protein